MFSSFFCVPRGRFFLNKMSLGEKKVDEQRRWHTEVAVVVIVPTSSVRCWVDRNS